MSPRFEPPPSPVSAPFWDATRERKLLLQWCVTCNAPIFYPREVCPGCLGHELEWREASGRGQVYAYTVDHRNAEELVTVALVELDEGVRMMSNVVNYTELSVSMPVSVTWEPLSDGRNLPVFEPTS
jgi:hypothetical protein